MWEQYKKTLWGMQVVIVLVTSAVIAWSHLVSLGMLFWIVMQVAAVLGAMWGKRLKDKIRAASGSNP